MEENEVMQPEETGADELEDVFAEMAAEETDTEQTEETEQDKEATEEAAEEQAQEESKPEETARPTPEQEFLEMMARESGMSVPEFIADTQRVLGEQRRAEAERKIADRVEQLLDQGMDEDFARHVAELEANKERLDAEQQRMAEQQARQSIIESVRSETMQRDFARFLQAHPDAAKEQATEDVLADIRAGMTPMEAYQRKEIAELRFKAEKAEKKELNKQTTPGSVKGGKVETDPFMDAFMGVFND